MKNNELPPAPPSVLTHRQRKTYGPKIYTEDGRRYRITATVRHDDECRNGHNTFSITGVIDEASGASWRDFSGSCIHDEIARHFPELAPFIKWHLMGTDQPLHYVSNTVYLASERDHWGCLKGEPHQWSKWIQFKGFPILWRDCSNWTADKFIAWCEEMGPAVGDCEVLEIQHDKRETFGPKYTLGGFPCAKWHECPFDSEASALQFIAACKLGFTVISKPSAWGEGKKRELDAARSAAVWPDATDAQLSAPKEELTAALLARLPALMQEFKAAVESLGFVY